MIIEIIDVQRTDPIAKSGKPYGLLTIAYRTDGKVQEKKIMSFQNPSVFKTLEGSSKGELWDVKAEKIGDYIQWTSITKSTGQVTGNSVSTTSNTGVSRVTGSNYETAEERAIKQKYIVRQSSLSNAVDILSVGAKSLTAESVLSLAEQLEDWVFRTEKKVELLVDISEIEDDVPY